MKMTIRYAITIFVITLVGCGQLAPGTGEGFQGKYGYQYALLREAIFLQFNDVLRPSYADLAWQQRTGSTNSQVKAGAIPMEQGVPGTNRRDICYDEGDPYCGGIAFGENLLEHPGIHAEITNWLINFCERFPYKNSNKADAFYLRLDMRQKVNQLRGFMECDTVVKEPRNIYIYLVRHFDDVFNHDDEHLTEALQKSIVKKYVLNLRQ